MTSDLLNSYSLQKDNVKLILNLEKTYLGMDTAVPLGIIINELVSNSLKYAFPDGTKGEIFITLGRVDSFNPDAGISGMEQCINEKRLLF